MNACEKKCRWINSVRNNVWPIDCHCINRLLSLWKCNSIAKRLVKRKIRKKREGSHPLGVLESEFIAVLSLLCAYFSLCSSPAPVQCAVCVSHIIGYLYECSSIELEVCSFVVLGECNTEKVNYERRKKPREFLFNEIWTDEWSGREKTHTHTKTMSAKKIIIKESTA